MPIAYPTNISLKCCSGISVSAGSSSFITEQLKSGRMPLTIAATGVRLQGSPEDEGDSTPAVCIVDLKKGMAATALARMPGHPTEGRALNDPSPNSSPLYATLTCAGKAELFTLFK
ncbi:Gdsl lipase acylhydrolase family protein [Echinococcus multilocularis]|uniref:Gdsl lipase acylhydrolase family protein n=1 Tax=Echinococcus multilocularis TaxID=6211 RepID=A0A0S4MQD2_ECHMU|nr:Gdsl lipase acylhydrolase family protein [Echinococcus multilocularis]